MTHLMSDVPSLKHLRGYLSIADFYERYWTINGKPAPPLKEYERAILDRIEAIAKKKAAEFHNK